MVVNPLDVLRADGCVVQNVADNIDLLLDVLKLLRVGASSSLRLNQLRSFDDAIGLPVEVLQYIVPVVEALAAR